VIVSGDQRAVAGTNVTEQVPAARLQLLDENAPGPSLDQATVPVGLAPVTVTVTVVGLPEETAGGLTWTEVLVTAKGYPIAKKAPEMEAVKAATGMSPHIDVPATAVMPVAVLQPDPVNPEK